MPKINHLSPVFLSAVDGACDAIEQGYARELSMFDDSLVGRFQELGGMTKTIRALVAQHDALRELVAAARLLDANCWFDADSAQPEIETGKAGMRTALAKLGA